MTTTYEVVRYAADGHAGEEGDGRVVASGLTLAEAKKRADKGHGSWKPTGPGEVIAYHDSATEGAGGYLVRKVMTDAERVSALLGNDGQRHEDERGRTLAEIAAELGARVEKREPTTDADRATRYAFPDGSAIVAEVGGWDLAYPRCWCWIGAGHRDDCPERDHCSLPGCERESYAAPKRGRIHGRPLCEAHYRRALRGSGSTAPARARGTETLRSLSLRLPVSVYSALGNEPGSRAREVLTRWARRSSRS